MKRYYKSQISSRKRDFILLEAEFKITKIKYQKLICHLCLSIRYIEYHVRYLPIYHILLLEGFQPTASGIGSRHLAINVQSLPIYFILLSAGFQPLGLIIILLTADLHPQGLIIINNI